MDPHTIHSLQTNDTPELAPGAFIRELVRAEALDDEDHALRGAFEGASAL